MSKDRILTTDDIDLVIDDEFKALLPVHTASESKAFAESVAAIGRYTESLKYWRHGGLNYLIDGHQRLNHWMTLPDDTPVPPPQRRRPPGRVR